MSEHIEAFSMEVPGDRAVFAQNRLPAHAELETFCGEELQSNRFLYLDGTWSFRYAENPSQIEAGFEKCDVDCHDWAPIQVPGHIQMQGYDIPHYTNTAYPWDGKEALARGEMPQEFNPVGMYVRYFDLPEAYAGRTLRISFQGVESAAAIWLNGRYVGYMENSFDPSEFDITPYVVSGENKLALCVFKWTAGSWCEDQDFFRFSGIYRSVYIYYVPEVHLEDIRIRPQVSEDLSSATMQVDACLSAPGQLRLQLTDPGENDRVVYDSGAFGEPFSVTSTEISDPHLWSAESPYLYKLTVDVLNTNGDRIERISQNVGFRRFEIRDGLMCLNGKRIVFKGVNRHEFSSRTGRIVSDEELLQDIVTMKRNNINAIRTCHYPDDVRIYDLCDRYGLYMIAENNMETHGTWIMHDPLNDPESLARGEKGKPPSKLSDPIPEGVIPGDDESWAPLLLDRINSCYQRDKNHPSILIWSIGNESFGGPVLQQMADRFRELDPDRLVHYEGLFHDRRYPDTSDMESQMYPSVADIEAFLQENPDKPFICCEYTHAMGNSCGGMHKYTDLSDREPRYQGGFIWDYIDQSLWAKNRYGEDYQAYGGDFGDRPASYEFSGNGIVYGDDRTPSPKMQEVKYNYQNISVKISDGKVRIINRFLFTPTSAYDCRVELLYNGIVIEETSLETYVAPLSEETYELPFYGREDRPGEYTWIVSFQGKEDTLWCEAGHEIAFGQWSCIHENYDAFSGIIINKNAPLSVIRGEENLGVRGDDFSVLFSGDKGGIVSYIYKGKQLLDRVPRPNFWRAPTDNDRGARSDITYAQWKLASLYQEHRTPEYFANLGPETRMENGCFFIKFIYHLATSPTSQVSVTYRVEPCGRITMTMDYEPVEGLPGMPEYGLLFTLDADFDHVQWYGPGPEETYADRKRGGRIGVYENRVQDNLARYLVPQECGNKEDVRYIQITDEAGNGLLFAGDKPMCASALPYTPHEMENASHPYELPPVHHTILRVAAAQMGVGGDDSWGATVHPEYLLDPTDGMHFEVSFIGIQS